MRNLLPFHSGHETTGLDSQTTLIFSQLFVMPSVLSEAFGKDVPAFVSNAMEDYFVSTSAKGWQQTTPNRYLASGFVCRELAKMATKELRTKWDGLLTSYTPLP